MSTSTETVSKNLPIPKFDSDELQTLSGKIRELYAYRYLLKNLVIRDLKVRYKNSLLGVVWSLLHPLLMMTVYTVLFTILIPNDDIEKYPVFILVALIPWQFHTGTLNSSAQSITGNAAIIKKVYFPRILLPLATMLSNLVNFLLASVVLLVLLFAFGVGLSIHALWVPLILLTQMVFLLGLGLIVATLHTFYRDTAMILEVGLLAWFFLTPIFYPFERLGTRTELFGIVFNQARLMRWLNPMASIVDSYRTVLWGNVGGNGPSAMDPLALLRTFITAVLIFIIGYIVFSRSEFLFGEKL
ncbi:MAG: ABC transporter permease [Ardenticatenaceae bacterium]|nr:ABC transporter permease [Anaerolineales bacterium]MCB9006618.1 ABC transporter permease [Ardenticatenaceae bacterium]